MENLCVVCERPITLDDEIFEVRYFPKRKPNQSLWTQAHATCAPRTWMTAVVRRYAKLIFSRG